MRRLAPVLVLAAAPMLARAQQPPAAPVSPPPAQQGAATQPPASGTSPSSGAPYSYDPAGRRDPFVSLLGRGSDPHGRGSRPTGLPGLVIGEISLKGIVRDRTGLFAIIQGPDNKSYILRAGDRLMDGSVKSVVPDGVVFSQDVNDPLSLVKQREIRKNLRPNEESRG